MGYASRKKPRWTRAEHVDLAGVEKQGNQTPKTLTLIGMITRKEGVAAWW